MIATVNAVDQTTYQPPCPVASPYDYAHSCKCLQLYMPVKPNRAPIVSGNSPLRMQLRCRLQMTAIVNVQHTKQCAKRQWRQSTANTTSLPSAHDGHCKVSSTRNSAPNVSGNSPLRIQLNRRQPPCPVANPYDYAHGCRCLQ